MSPPVIELTNVTRSLTGEVPVTLVQDIDLTISEGEFISVTGPSGSGKSSLLYLLGLLDQPSEGQITINGTETSTIDEATLAELRLSTLGFVFQFHFLLPEFTVAQNVALPMRRLGRLSNREMTARAQELLGDLGMGESLQKRPDQLSGGQRQRVAIARALANDPAVILADESTGNLDSKNSLNVFETFRELAHKQGRAIVAVTHEHDLADMADRRIHLVDGRVVAKD